jgi:hypothetical protein
MAPPPPLFDVPGGHINLRNHGVYRLPSGEYAALECGFDDRVRLYNQCMLESIRKNASMVNSAYPRLCSHLRFLISAFTGVFLPVPFMLHFFRIKQRALRIFLPDADSAQKVLNSMLLCGASVFGMAEHYKTIAQYCVYSKDLEEPKNERHMIIQFFFAEDGGKHHTPAYITRVFEVDEYAVFVASQVMLGDSPIFFVSTITPNGTPDIREQASFLGLLQHTCGRYYMRQDVCIYNPRSDFFWMQMKHVRQQGLLFCTCKHNTQCPEQSIMSNGSPGPAPESAIPITRDRTSS